MAQREPAVLDAKNPASPFYYPDTKTALLLMDFQRITVGMMTDEQQRATVVRNACALRDWAREHNVLILHCLIDTAQSPTPQRKITVQRWPFLAATLQAHPGIEEEIPELKPSSLPSSSSSSPPLSELTLKRKTGSFTAMMSHGIRQLLEEKGIESLIMAGVSTAGCVLGTARGAADEGFVVTVIEDACGDPVPGQHEMLCSTAIVASSNILNLQSWIKHWEAEER